MDLAAILRALYDHELNFTITAFWDVGVQASVGDPLNGILAKRTFQPEELGTIADWLVEEARRAGYDLGPSSAN